MKIVDLTHLKWGTTHNGGTSYGCYYKAIQIENGIKYYYKCSNFYSGQNCFGDESIYEVICSRLFQLLGFDCVKYTVCYAKVKIDDMVFNTYVCKSKNYFVGYDSRATLEDLQKILGLRNSVETINKLCIQREIEKLLVADFLVLQRDRHGKNIEILIKDNKYYLAPLFDNGLGLLAPYPVALTNLDKIKQFDVLHDYPVNNCIGTRSLYDNLNLLSSPVLVNRLKREDKKKLFYGLNSLLPKEYIDKIWELITYRYMFLRKRGVIID